MDIELRTPRLLLRAATVADAPVLATLTGEADPVGERLRRSAALVASSEQWYVKHGYGLWVLERPPAKEIIGWCGLRPREQPEAPELLYGVAPAVRGQGFATEAIEAVINWLFSRPDVTGVWAVTDPTNTASARVLERAGLAFEQRNDFDGLDSLIYRISAAAWCARGT